MILITEQHHLQLMEQMHQVELIQELQLKE